MRRVFVTGVTGFLGARIAELLIDHGCELAVLVRNGGAARLGADIQKNCTIIHGDLSNADSYSTALRAFRPDTVIHAAWSGVSGAQRDAHVQVQNIVDGVALLEIAASCGCRVFVGLGSQAEYGSLNRKVSEVEPTDPTTLYGISKLAFSKISATFCRVTGLRHVWIRVFSVYGPRDHSSAMIPSLIRRLQAGEQPKLTACDQLWDFLYIDDAALAVIRAAERTDVEGVFNLGSGSAPLLRDTVSFLRDCVSPGAVLGFGAIPYAPGQVMHLEADITKLVQKTGWHPAWPLNKGLQATARYYLDLG